MKIEGKKVSSIKDSVESQVHPPRHLPARSHWVSRMNNGTRLKSRTTRKRNARKTTRQRITKTTSASWCSNCDTWANKMRSGWRWWIARGYLRGNKTPPAILTWNWNCCLISSIRRKPECSETPEILSTTRISHSSGYRRISFR